VFRPDVARSLAILAGLAIAAESWSEGVRVAAAAAAWRRRSRCRRWPRHRRRLRAALALARPDPGAGEAAAARAPAELVAPAAAAPNRGRWTAPSTTRYGYRYWPTATCWGSGPPRWKAKSSARVTPSGPVAAGRPSQARASAGLRRPTWISAMQRPGRLTAGW